MSLPTWRRLLPLLLLVAVLRADDERPPMVLFREPDRATKKEILEKIGWLASSRHRDDTERTAARYQARKRLSKIGPWAVPYLAEALAKRSERIRMNAAITIAFIRDPRGLAALRRAAQQDESLPVRRTACLALGRFRRVEDGALLTTTFQDKRLKASLRAAAALALAKVPDPTAPETLRLGALELDGDEHLAAATLLAAVITGRGTDVTGHLSDRNRALVRRTAAVCLLLRPLPAEKADELLKVLKRSEKKKEIRALQVEALAAMPRTADVRARLLTLARREKKEAQVAALLGLAREWGVTENYTPLRKIGWKRENEVSAAVMFALARTGEPKAVKDLLTTIRARPSQRLVFYAGGSLVHALVDGRLGKKRAEILKELGDLRGWAKDSNLLRLIEAARHPKDQAAEFGKVAMDEPMGLWLEPDNRGWWHANRLLELIFELDEIADQGDPFSKKPDSPVGGGDGDTHKAASGNPLELDLLDFLSRKPYFGPKDLRGGR